jgi:hypothetical protein
LPQAYIASLELDSVALSDVDCLTCFEDKVDRHHHYMDGIRLQTLRRVL